MKSFYGKKCAYIYHYFNTKIRSTLSGFELYSSLGAPDMFGRKDQYYLTKGDILAHSVSGSNDILTVLLYLTAGNIFSTCIVLQNVSVC